MITKKQLAVPDQSNPFWTAKTLEQMTNDEWEALCDGCGRCCLQKLEDRKTGKVHYTWVACYLFDIEKCRCTAYARTDTPGQGVFGPDTFPG